MAKKEDISETKDAATESAVRSTETQTAAKPQVAQPATPTPVEQQEQATVQIDDSLVSACYANFCRVSSSPEELVLDLGLNPHPYGTGHTIKISQRVILNHYTAKRLLSALSMAVQRHEQVFGVLETDVRKRVRTNP